MRINKYYKTAGIILIMLTLLPMWAMSQNNRTRQASCANGSRSRLYITPYVGFGQANYKYELNNTVVGPAPDSLIFDKATSKPFTPMLGINLMYNFSKASLGGGAEWQGFRGKINNGLTRNDLNLYYFKFYGRYEYTLYRDAFKDIGLLLEAGVLFPKNYNGISANMGTYFKGGVFYSWIINSTSALFIALDYQYAGFENQVGNAVSKHTSTDIKLSIGYRFWMK